LGLPAWLVAASLPAAAHRSLPYSATGGEVGRQVLKGQVTHSLLGQTLIGEAGCNLQLTAATPQLPGPVVKLGCTHQAVNRCKGMVRVIGLEACKGPASEAVENLFRNHTTRPGQLNAGLGIGRLGDRSVATRGERRRTQGDSKEHGGKAHHLRR